MNRAERRAAARLGGRHGFDCGCSHLVIRACDGVCDRCGRPDSVTFPPMPSSAQVGDVTEVGWACRFCDGEVTGRGVVTQVL